jgi:hypothetical protein
VGTAWGQVSDPADQPPPVPIDEVEQKPLSEAEYQRAREQRAQQEAERRHASGEDEAESPPPLGPETKTEFEFGVRSGFGVPFGQASADATGDLSSLLSTQFPIWGDLGLRFADKIFFGLQGSYGFGHLSSDITSACDHDRALGASVDCHGSDTRVGLELLYHGQASPTVDLWVGGGLGWEWLSIGADESFQGQSQKVTIGANGMQLMMLQAGVDFEPIPNLGIGPFFALSNDMYFTVKTSCTGSCGGEAGGNAAIENRSVHHWLFFGVRASYRP